MPAQLVSLDNVASIMLDKPILLVGRHPECDIQIDSRKISRRHCCVAQVANYLVIRDLGSTNGIRINGNRVNEGKLVPGDEVTIGNNRYRVTWDSIIQEAKALPVAPMKNGPGAGKGREAQPPPVKARALADEMLEDCDDPVPLADDDMIPSAQRTPPSPVPVPFPAPVKIQPGDSQIFPDSLELMPRSDILPPGADQAPAV